MKKIILTTLLFSFLLSACGNNDKEKIAFYADPKNEKEYHKALRQCELGISGAKDCVL